MICAAIFTLVLATPVVASAQTLTAGVAAPEFDLVDQHGERHSLEAHRGKWVVLYFYPKNDTPGCTKEACGFRDDIFSLRALSVQVLGISVDSTESHARFAEKHGLPFPLLADEDGSVARAYDALFSLGFVKWAKRHTFIIDPQGRLAKVYRDVDPATHSDRVIADVKTLQGQG
jgi:peroxiredoxin Q/BCP